MTDSFEMLINEEIKIQFKKIHFTGASILLFAENGNLQATILMNGNEYDTLVNRCKEAKSKK
jgi:hypothetical protein